MPSDKLARLFELIRAVASERDFERLPERALEAALEISRAERGFLVLVNGSIEVRASRNFDGDEIREAQAKISRTVLERVMASDRPVVLRDGEISSQSLRSQKIRAVCALPLRAPTGAIGAIYLDHRFEPGVFGAEDLDLLAAIGAQAAIGIEQARLRDALARRVHRQEVEISTLRRPTPIVGSSLAIRNVLRLVEKFAPLPYPVLLQGESGTGKELVARAIYAGSPRAARNFLAADVAAVPEGLFESEMFGHVRGAFTGAAADHEGLFERARGGTLFLDEINSLSQAMQEKLLRVLEEREIRRVGGTQTVPIDFRLIVATNENLEASAFRKDLYHRLNVLRIDLPPLRDRREDIPALVDYFLNAIADQTGRRCAATPEVFELLGRHGWPGNVRELENALRRAAALAEGGRLEPEHFRLSPDEPRATELLTRDDYMRAAIREHGPRMRVRELAARLGVSRKTLWETRRRLGIS